MAVLGAAGFFAFQAAERWGEQRLQEEMELVARTLREPVSRALTRSDEDTLRASLSSVFEFNRVYSAHIYNAQGERIATAGAAAALKESPIAAPVFDLRDERGEFGRVGQRDVFSFFVPLADRGGRVIGILQITRRASDFSQQAEELRWTATGFIGVTGLLLVILVLAGHHFFIGRPLGALSRSMAAVGAGERGHRSTPDGPRELAELSRTFNRMLDNMDRAEHEIAVQRDNREHLEKRLRHAEKMASIGRLAAGVAHEIGTPLATIDGRAQRLLRDEPPESDRRRTLDSVRTQVDRIGHIVRQLLAFGKGYRGSQWDVRLNQCARGAMEATRSAADRAGVDLTCAGAEPGAAARMDRDRIEEALIHLLRNAVQAAGKGGRVRLTWSASDGWAEFHVEDDGPGIPRALRDRVMDPFFTTKSVGEGSGLGLAVAHGIAEGHGGSLEIRKAELGGAAVILRLPVTADPGPMKA